MRKVRVHQGLQARLDGPFLARPRRRPRERRPRVTQCPLVGVDACPFNSLLKETALPFQNRRPRHALTPRQRRDEVVSIL
jgi:hypothetical protein